MCASNNGGPGAPDIDSVLGQARTENGIQPIGMFSKELREVYDVIGLDMRGDGLSQPILCDGSIRNRPVKILTTNEAEFDALAARNRDFAESCSNMTGPYYKFLGTDQRIRDIDLVRESLGEEKFNYRGFSYGTQIGAEYAEMWPEKVDRMVLDGVMNRGLSNNDAVITLASAFESSFNYFMDWCNRTSECALHGEDILTMWDELLTAADEKKLTMPECEDTCHQVLTAEDSTLR